MARATTYLPGAIDMNAAFASLLAPHVAPPSGGEPVHCECFAITCSLEFSDDS